VKSTTLSKRDRPMSATRSTVLLDAKDLAMTYGIGSRQSVEAIRSLTFEIKTGEFCCIIGPSGCGKTTLLKLLSGLLTPTKGIARLHGQAIETPPAAMALVFQDYSRSLLPWMSVVKNVKLPLVDKVSGKEQDARARQALAAVGLDHVADLYPWQLSGGMQQRTAIARALAYQPEILLMDEPFASVDAQTRGDLEDLILRVWGEFGLTVAFVTHDIDESVYLADRVIVLGPSPTQVKEVIDIDLPRPRDQILTKELPEFAQLRTQLYRLVKRSPDGKRATSDEPRDTAPGSVR
jgi:NitT/TauT family transport system ATP-binding protein